MFTLRREGGFSTVELLITLVVIGMVFVIFSELNTNTTGVVARSEDASIANEAANRIIQYFENLKCEETHNSIDECLPNASYEIPNSPGPLTDPEYSGLINDLGAGSKATVLIQDQDVDMKEGSSDITGLLKKINVEVSYGKNQGNKITKATIVGLGTKGGSH